MESSCISFDEHKTLHALAHYLPAQAALKDFVHHNTLHAFQHHRFQEAIAEASQIFGYRTTLSLEEFRERFQKGQIREDVLNRVIAEQKGNNSIDIWKARMLETPYQMDLQGRIGAVRACWKSVYKINLDKIIHPFLFRLAGSYLDQGISIGNFPVSGQGFLTSLREMDANSYVKFFKTRRARRFFADEKASIADVLQILVGKESLFEAYLFDQQFAHPGWSGMVSTIEVQPETLLDPRKITLREWVFFELLLELDAMDKKFGENWRALGYCIDYTPEALFALVKPTQIQEVLFLWQLAFEWSYYDDVLAGIKVATSERLRTQKSFQAVFCIDDREYSLRRIIEHEDASSETFATPGFFGVEFFFQPENGQFYTKACPAPVTPKFLIKEGDRKNGYASDVHYSKQAHLPVRGWLISQTIGFWSALRLFLNIFKPSVTPATAYSFRHMDKHSQLTIQSDPVPLSENGLQVGFSIDEMTLRVKNTLTSIGLVKDFAPLLYIVGHGASSVNNTHYAGYDCGACCGRPGAVNARVFSAMANHKEVRKALAESGIHIPEGTWFLGAMHDTTRDEIEYYDEQMLPQHLKDVHKKGNAVIQKSLLINAKERSRRFDTVDTRATLEKIHSQVKRRSVSLFEPRPELNHATNALCIIGRACVSKDLFLDRRPFMNSYDYRVDPEGKYLLTILNAAAPVCGGINLEYYFSRVDNEKLGAGTKLPHTVIGLFAVANGVDGDLRPGLPSQMIEVHDPVRILFIVEHYPEVVLHTIRQNPATYEWFANDWVKLAVKYPEKEEVLVFENAEFVPYNPLQQVLEEVKDVMPIIESHQDNIPVLINP